MNPAPTEETAPLKAAGEGLIPSPPIPHTRTSAHVAIARGSILTAKALRPTMPGRIGTRRCQRSLLPKAARERVRGRRSRSTPGSGTRSSRFGTPRQDRRPSQPRFWSFAPPPLIYMTPQRTEMLHLVEKVTRADRKLAARVRHDYFDAIWVSEWLSDMCSAIHLACISSGTWARVACNLTLPPCRFTI